MKCCLKEKLREAEACNSMLHNGQEARRCGEEPYTLGEKWKMILVIDKKQEAAHVSFMRMITDSLMNRK